MDFLKSILLSEARMKDAAMDLVYTAAEAVPKSDDQEKYFMKVVAKVLALDKDKLFKGDAVAAEKMVKQILGESVVAEGKGYQEIKIKDVVAELGGLDAIKKKVKNSKAAYSLMLKGQTAVAKKLLDKGAHEVGELNASDIADWCDNHFDSVNEDVVAEGDVIPFPKKKVERPAAKPVAKTAPVKKVADKSGPKDVWAKATDKDYPLTEKGIYKLLSDLDADAQGKEDYLSKDARFKDVNVKWPLTVEWVTQQTSGIQDTDTAKQIAKVLKRAGFTGITVKVAVRDNWDGDKTPWKKAKS